MDFTSYGTVHNAIHFRDQLIVLSHKDAHFILSSISLETWHCLWTWDPLNAALFHVPYTEEPTSLHTWQWNVSNNVSTCHTFLLVRVGSRAWCAHITDGATWGTASSRKLPAGGHATTFKNRLIVMDDHRTKLVEYTLPRFKKQRLFAFRSPIQHVLCPAAHVYIVATADILTQFYPHTSKWGVTYNISGITGLRCVRIDHTILLASTETTLVLLSLNGRLLGKVSAIYGSIQDFAVVRTSKCGVELIIVEDVTHQRSVNGDDDIGDDIGAAASKHIARFARVNWKSDSSNATNTSPWLAVESRERICPLNHFLKLIAVDVDSILSKPHKTLARAIFVIKPDSIQTLHYRDFSLV